MSAHFCEYVTPTKYLNKRDYKKLSMHNMHSFAGLTFYKITRVNFFLFNYKTINHFVTTGRDILEEFFLLKFQCKFC